MTLLHPSSFLHPLRPRPRRRGSVLILIVALLVLMALIGTAFLVTTRTDRFAARQHVYNVQADMAVQSAVNMVVAELSADLFAPSGDRAFNFVKPYRPPPHEGDTVTPYETWDGFGGDDVLLSARVPVLMNTQRNVPVDSLYPQTPNRRLFPFDPGGINPPVWLTLSGWPTLPSNLEPAISRTIAAPTARPYLGQPLWPHLQLYYNGIPYDADQSTPGVIDPVPAADADGDGIADAFLWKLPMGPLNGVTYYAAVRVIDNNSAINVNTALARDSDFEGGRGKPLQISAYFTGRVGLAELLRTYPRRNIPSSGSSDPLPPLTQLGRELNALNKHRFNTDPLLRVAGVNGAAGLFEHPFDDNGKPRLDFQFLSVGDAVERQLGSRIGNPGSSLGAARYRPFTLSDSLPLAYRFCLDTSASRGELEQVLPSSLFFFGDSRTDREEPVPKAPYRADQTGDWIERFRYDQENPFDSTTFRDLRALLVTRNPLSNQSPAHFSPDDINGDGYRNDMASALAGTGAPVGGAFAETLQKLPLTEFATPPYAGMEPLNKLAAPGANHVSVRAVPKVSINTAAFPELWRGFWSVMCVDDDNVSAPLPPVATIVGGDPFIGNAFEVEKTDLETGQRLKLQPQDQFDNTAFAAIDERNANMMFRSSIRDVRPTESGMLPKRFSANAQMLLRSALAAVNAEDLRDTDQDVTSHLIELRVQERPYFGATERVAVRVFGTERQPYLTEVYVNTDDRETGPGGTSNPKGYVAIELHNPYRDDIPLGGPNPDEGWSVGLIDRRSPALGGSTKLALAVRNLAPTGPIFRFPPGTVVPGTVGPGNGGYLVLENYDPTGAGPNAARYRPKAAQRGGLPETGAVPGRTIYVPNLHRVLQDPVEGTSGGEFVLLRTRRADGTCRDTITTPDSDPRADQYDEKHNLRDMVPVDQFDFTGATLPKAMTGTQRFKIYTALHYVRANGPDAPWKFVYPGRYDGRRDVRRQQGTIQVTFGRGPVNDDNMFVEEPIERYAPQVLLGAADPVAQANQGSFPIQLAAEGWQGANPIGPSGNMYPFGMFGRLADILQVPFIGAYTVYAPAGGAGALPTDVLYEMNSVSMDSAFAEDTDTTDDPSPSANPRDQREQIGRFCPVRVSVPNAKGTRVDDYTRLGQYPVQPEWQDLPDGGRIVEENTLSQPSLRYRYRWAMDLFDHFTIQAPHNDFFPNVAPSLYKYKNASGSDLYVSPAPRAVSNSGGVAGNSDTTDVLPNGQPDESNDYVEDLQPVEGLININTAPWKVLAALPMVLDDSGRVDVALNAELAKAIVYFRDVDGGGSSSSTDLRGAHGPFKSIYELNEVVEMRPDALLVDRAYVLRLRGRRNPPGFQNAYGKGAASGDASAGPVRGDFQDRYRVLNRISNLITTRSDTFTCYVYVMGVLHDGTPSAELKVQRRAAFVADRSGVRPLRPVVRTQFFNSE